MLPKSTFSKPMTAGDSTLMMLLSLNLLLLVFFVLLNSMATKDKQHSDHIMAQMAEGYGLPAGAAQQTSEENGQDAPLTLWRAGVIARVQGVVNNRLDLRVAPQQGNAGKIQIDLPLNALFDADGKLARPETIRNIAAAAGAESRVVWQVKGQFQNTARLTGYAAALAREVGRVEVITASTEGLRVLVTPGVMTHSSMGLQVQQVGEEAGGTVEGVQEKVVPRE